MHDLRRMICLRRKYNPVVKYWLDKSMSDKGGILSEFIGSGVGYPYYFVCDGSKKQPLLI